MNNSVTSGCLAVSLALVLFGTGKSVKAQTTTAQADSKLSALMEKIGTEKRREWDGKDAQVDAVSDELIAFLKAAGTNPELMTASLEKAEKSGLGIVTSPDKKLRIYNWDSQTGGTMVFFDAVAQYYTGKGNETKAAALHPKPRDPNARDGDNIDPAYSYEAIETVRTVDGKTVYLLFGIGKGSTIDHNSSIEAFTVKNGELVQCPIFRNGKQTSHEMQRYFHEFPDAPDGPVVTSFELSKDKRVLRAPETTEDGRTTGKWLVYRFDGHVFSTKQK